MLDTFIKNKGITKTIIHKNNKNYYNEVNWDTDYDGEKANISLDIDENGKKGHVEMKMNNDELAELLNIPSENSMLDKRLYKDFLSKRSKSDHNLIEIEIPNQYDNSIPKSILYRHPRAKDSLIYEKNNKRVHFQNEHSQESLPLENEMGENIYTHVSSPVTQEEILIPLVINEPKTRKHRHHRRPKTHVTYKVYRKNKQTSSHPSPSSSHSSRKTLRRNHKIKNHRSRRTF